MISIDRDFVAGYLELRLSSILAAMPEGKTLALWGAGGHSRFLLDHLPPYILERIQYFIDESAGEISDFPAALTVPEKADWSRIAGIVISSDRRQEALHKRARDFVPNSMPIYRLYCGLPLDAIAEARHRESTLRLPGSDGLSAFRAFASSADVEFPKLDLSFFCWLKSRLDSADFIMTELQGARNLVTRFDLLEGSLKLAPATGLVMEFGVFSGASLAHLAGLTDRKVYGFDSFEGLPELWFDKFEPGMFSLDRQAPVNMPPNVELVTGLFEDSLPGFLESHEGPCAFAHIDCDLFSSAKSVLINLAPRMITGTILVFDELIGYPGWQLHEYRALKEFLAATGIRIAYIGYASSWFSVAVKVI
jgi:hypothetical protein